MVSQSKPESIDWPDLPPCLKVRNGAIEVPVGCSNHNGELGNDGEDLNPPDKSKKECELKKRNESIISVIKCLLLLIVGWRNKIWRGIEHSEGVEPVKDIPYDDASHQSWHT